MKEIVFATGNRHKVEAVNLVLNPLGYIAKPMKDYGITEDIVEDGDTMQANARIKTDYLWNKLGIPCIGEDSGLEVDVLDGAPGIYTARYAGVHGDDEANMDKLLRALAGVEDRSAQFRAILSYRNGDEQAFFEGIIRGRIAEEKTGSEGFGYDPIFIPQGREESFAVLGASYKSKVSHRGQTVRAFVEYISRKSI